MHARVVAGAAGCRNGEEGSDVALQPVNCVLRRAVQAVVQAAIQQVREGVDASAGGRLGCQNQVPACGTALLVKQSFFSAFEGPSFLLIRHSSWGSSALLVVVGGAGRAAAASSLLEAWDAGRVLPHTLRLRAIMLKLPHWRAMCGSDNDGILSLSIRRAMRHHTGNLLGRDGELRRDGALHSDGVVARFRLWGWRGAAGGS